MYKSLFAIFLWVSPLFIQAQSPFVSVLLSYKDSLSNHGVVALYDNGKSIQTGAIGKASSEQKMSTENTFCIASVSKMYTATIILKLQELGKLDISDPIQNYLPNTSFANSKITITQLLQHTSGIPDVIDASLTNEALKNPNINYSDEHLISLIDTANISTEKEYSYSNSNYMLLRIIAEKASGKSYEQLIKKHIIKPLKLKNTFAFHSESIEGLAHPMMGNDDLHGMSKKGINAISKGLGNIVTTAEELNTFIRALLIEHSILSQPSNQLMTTFNTSKNHRTGLGIFSETYENKTVYGHSGRTVGYVAFAFIHPKTKESVVVLSNDANDEYAEKILLKLWAQH